MQISNIKGYLCGHGFYMHKRNQLQILNVGGEEEVVPVFRVSLTLWQSRPQPTTVWLQTILCRQKVRGSLTACPVSLMGTYHVILGH